MISNKIYEKIIRSYDNKKQSGITCLFIYIATIGANLIKQSKEKFLDNITQKLSHYIVFRTTHSEKRVYKTFKLRYRTSLTCDKLVNRSVSKI